MTWMIESTRNASLTPADVFRLYADPSTWSAWGHGAALARAEGQLVEGGIVQVRGNYGRVYLCRITRLISDRLLELEVRPPMMRVLQTYEVVPTPTGSRVRHALEVSAPFAGVMRLLGVAWMYQRLLDKEVGKLIDMASRPSGQPVVNPS